MSSTDHAPAVRAPTLEQVAARAGVGRGTVSRVINGSPQVSDSKRTAVMRAVDELGYVPNRAARSLVTRATDTIALVVSESEDRVFGEPFFGQLVRGVSRALAGSPRQLMVTMGEPGGGRSGLEAYLSPQHVDGVLLVSLRGDDRLPHLLARRGVPAVMVGRTAQPGTVPFVDVDNEGGAFAMVTHLAATGRRRIATVTGPPDMASGRARLAGYRSALAQAGLPQDERLVARGDFSGASGTRAAAELLERAPDLDAVFCASDQMAVSALGALARAGRRVPDDVAVAGFDDSPISRHLTPALTTVHQPVELLGARMTQLLTDLIEGRPVHDVVLPTRLVVRAST